LERLYLDHNAIRDLPPQIANLRSLRFLTLSHNQLQHVQPALQLPILVGELEPRTLVCGRLVG